MSNIIKWSRLDTPKQSNKTKWVHAIVMTQYSTFDCNFFVTDYGLFPDNKKLQDNLIAFGSYRSSYIKNGNIIIPDKKGNIVSYKYIVKDNIFYKVCRELSNIYAKEHNVTFKSMSKSKEESKPEQKLEAKEAFIPEIDVIDVNVDNLPEVIDVTV